MSLHTLALPFLGTIIESYSKCLKSMAYANSWWTINALKLATENGVYHRMFVSICLKNYSITCGSFSINKIYLKEIITMWNFILLDIKVYAVPKINFLTRIEFVFVLIARNIHKLNNYTIHIPFQPQRDMMYSFLTLIFYSISIHAT